MKKIYSLLLVMVILFAGCGKENVPEVITGDVFNVTATTASISGNVLDDNNSDITEAGYCWGTNENITYENNLGIVKDAFVGNGNMIDYTITDLLPAETYFVRAFAVNGVGIGYGNVKQFVVS
ncbi:MAG: fibronectin type III domain-containing protein, partial [Bacteroidales bacterium]|nr:fibronectin type III domain-containing protein [Bacteroidales bacterium]